MIVLDTNIIIGRLQADTHIIRVLDAQRELGESFSVSVITELELFAHPALRAQESLLIERLLRTFRVVPLDSTLARRAALLRQLTGLKLGDSIIAATAILLDAPLMTRDKAFQKMEGIKVIIP